jgi:hypothetical protein
MSYKDEFQKTLDGLFEAFAKGPSPEILFMTNGDFEKGCRALGIDPAATGKVNMKYSREYIFEVQELAKSLGLQVRRGRFSIRGNYASEFICSPYGIWWILSKNNHWNAFARSNYAAYQYLKSIKKDGSHE